MKILSIILSILMLTLSVQPVCASECEGICDEAVSCCIKRSSSHEHSDVHKDCSTNNHEKKSAGGCNPFQICVCCAFCVTIPDPFNFQVLPLTQKSKPDWGSKPQSVSDEPVFSFWQPPRTV